MEKKKATTSSRSERRPLRNPTSLDVAEASWHLLSVSARQLILCSALITNTGAGRRRRVTLRMQQTKKGEGV